MIYSIEFLAAVIAYIYLFWLMFVLVMGFYRAQLAGRLHGWVKWMAMPVVGLGMVMDNVAQYTIACVIFLEGPKGQSLVTSRLKRYMSQSIPAAGFLNLRGRWQRWLAYQVCEKLLDPFDPTGEHC